MNIENMKAMRMGLKTKRMSFWEKDEESTALDYEEITS
jgi:hypothetical protein